MTHSWRFWIGISLAVSFVGHLLFGLSLLLPKLGKKEAENAPYQVKIRTVQRPAPQNTKPKSLPPPRAKPAQIGGQKKPDANAPPVEADPSAVVSDQASDSESSTASGPSGNDLSSDARMIPESVIVPQYTEEAIDANIEGVVGVDVFVDASGQVTDVELHKSTGFGMDERIVASAWKVRFYPRRDKLGRPLAGWTQIKFRLEIP